MAGGWGTRAALAIGGVLPGAVALAVTLARHYPADSLNRLYAAVLLSLAAGVAALLWVLVAPGRRQAAWRAAAWLVVLVPCAMYWGGR
ncbi:membrane protein [Burkholderia cepacia]|nr:membrane protein [Burkholderia cepacia]